MTHSHQFPRTRKLAKRWLLAFEHINASSSHGELYECEHGHCECSIDPGGACLHEILCAYPGLEEDDDPDEHLMRDMSS